MSAHVYAYARTRAQYSCYVSNPEEPDLWEQGQSSLWRHNGVSQSMQNRGTRTCKDGLISAEEGMTHTTLLLPVLLMQLKTLEINAGRDKHKQEISFKTNQSANCR